MGYEMSILMAGEETVAGLVRRAREGDRAAFDALAARLRDRLLASLHTRPGAADPEDIPNAYEADARICRACRLSTAMNLLART